MKRILFILFAATILTSCSKDKKTSNPPQQPPHFTDEQLLLASQFSISATDDTTNATYYSYDSNNRLILEVSKLYPGNIDSATYTYDANGNVVTLHEKLGILRNVLFTISYNSANEPTHMTVDNLNDYRDIPQDIQFTVSNHKLTQITIPSPNTITAITYDGDNVKTIGNRTLNYGQYKSPFYSSNFKWNIYIQGNGLLESYIPLSGQNNITKITTDQGAGIKEVLNLNYTYNSAGYPLTRTADNSGAKVVYNYTPVK